MTDIVLAPDERALRAHLQTGRYQAGVEAGRWRDLSVEWPIVIVAVSAAPRPGAPQEFAIRFDLTGYPNTAPTGCIWDMETNTMLPADKRPKGERAGLVFRFEGGCGPTAMYAPWDRGALYNYNWAQQAPRLAWHAGRDLTFVLENVHEILNADDYLGT